MCSQVPQVIRDGVRLHYADVGSGPAVFFHTGGGGDGTIWEAAGHFDKMPRRRYPPYDHPGPGPNDPPTSVEAQQFDEYVAARLAIKVSGRADPGARLRYPRRP